VNYTQVNRFFLITSKAVIWLWGTELWEEYKKLGLNTKAYKKQKNKTKKLTKLKGENLLNKMIEWINTTINNKEENFNYEIMEETKFNIINDKINDIKNEINILTVDYEHKYNDKIKEAIWKEEIKNKLELEVSSILQEKLKKQKIFDETNKWEKQLKRWTYITYTDEELRKIQERWNLVDNTDKYNFEWREKIKRTDEDWVNYLIPTNTWPMNSLIYRRELQQDFWEDFDIEKSLSWLTPEQKQKTMENFYKNYKDIKTSWTYFADKVSVQLQNAFLWTIKYIQSDEDEKGKLKLELDETRTEIKSTHIESKSENENIREENILKKITNLTTDKTEKYTITKINEILNDTKTNLINNEDKQQNIFKYLWQKISNWETEWITKNNYKEKLKWYTKFISYYENIIIEEEVKEKERKELNEKLSRRKRYISTLINISEVYINFYSKILQKKYPETWQEQIKEEQDALNYITQLDENHLLSIWTIDEIGGPNKLNSQIKIIFNWTKLDAIVNTNNPLLETIRYNSILWDINSEYKTNKEPGENLENIVNILSYWFWDKDNDGILNRENKRQTDENALKIKNSAILYIRAIDISDQRTFNKLVSWTTIYENIYNDILSMDFNEFPQENEKDKKSIENINNSFDLIKTITEPNENWENDKRLDEIILLAKNKNEEWLTQYIKKLWIHLKSSKYNEKKLAKQIIKIVKDEEKSKETTKEYFKWWFEIEFSKIEDEDNKKITAMRTWISICIYNGKINEDATEVEIENFIKTYFEHRYWPAKASNFAWLKNDYAQMLYEQKLNESIIWWFRRKSMEYVLEWETKYVKKVKEWNGEEITWSNTELFGLYADIEWIWKWDLKDDNTNLLRETSKLLLEEIGIALISFWTANAFIKIVQWAKRAWKIYKLWRLTRLARKYKAIEFLTNTMKCRSLVGLWFEIISWWFTYTVTDHLIRWTTDKDYERNRNNFGVEILQNWIMVNRLRMIDELFLSKEIVNKISNFWKWKTKKIIIEEIWMFWQDATFNLINWTPPLTKETIIQNIAMWLIFELIFSKMSYKEFSSIKIDASSGTTKFNLQNRNWQDMFSNNIDIETMKSFITELDYNAKDPNNNPYAWETNIKELNTEIKRINDIMENLKQKNPNDPIIKLFEITKVDLNAKLKMKTSPKWDDNINKPDNKPNKTPEKLPKQKDILNPHPDDIITIWDLDWSFKKFKKFLEDANIAKFVNDWWVEKIEWTWWNKHVIFIWDILWDRSPTSIRILQDIAELKRQIALDPNCEGKVTYIVWNHDDIVISLLMKERLFNWANVSEWDFHFTWIREFFWWKEEISKIITNIDLTTSFKNHITNLGQEDLNKIITNLNIAKNNIELKNKWIKEINEILWSHYDQFEIEQLISIFWEINERTINIENMNNMINNMETKLEKTIGENWLRSLDDPEYKTAMEILCQSELVSISNWILHTHVWSMKTLDLIINWEYEGSVKTSWWRTQEINVKLEWETIADRVDEINTLRQKCLTYSILWEWQRPTDLEFKKFNEVANVILDSNWWYWELKNNNNNRTTEYAQDLKDNWVNWITHWHVKSIDEVTWDFTVKSWDEDVNFPIRNADRMRGKGQSVVIEKAPAIVKKATYENLTTFDNKEFETILSNKEKTQEYITMINELPFTQFNAMDDITRLKYSALIIKTNFPDANFKYTDLVNIDWTYTEMWNNILTAHKDWAQLENTIINEGDWLLINPSIAESTKILKTFFEWTERKNKTSIEWKNIYRVLTESYVCGHKEAKIKIEASKTIDEMLAVIKEEYKIDLDIDNHAFKNDPEHFANILKYSIDLLEMNNRLTIDKTYKMTEDTYKNIFEEKVDENWELVDATINPKTNKIENVANMLKNNDYIKWLGKNTEAQAQTILIFLKFPELTDRIDIISKIFPNWLELIGYWSNGIVFVKNKYEIIKFPRQKMFDRNVVIHENIRQQLFYEEIQRINNENWQEFQLHVPEIIENNNNWYSVMERVQWKTLYRIFMEDFLIKQEMTTNEIKLLSNKSDFELQKYCVNNYGYMPSTNTSKIITKLYWEDKARLFKEYLSKLENRWLNHNDIKKNPWNLMIDNNWKFYLIDFGESTINQNSPIYEKYKELSAKNWLPF